jgi:hypothetical protein
MALDFVDGFDSHGAVTDVISKWNYTNSNMLSFSTTAGLRGGKCLQVADNTLRWLAAYRALSAMHGTAAGDEQYCAFWLNITKIPTAANAGIIFVAQNDLGFVDNSFSVYSSPSAATTTALELYIDTTGKLVLKRNGTTLATGTVVYTTGTGYIFIECKYLVASAGGVFEVRVNGGATETITFTGNTKAGGVAGIAGFALYTSGNSTGANYRIDDMMAWNGQGAAPNGYIGPCAVDTTRPSGAGTLAQGTASAGANFSCVDETVQNGSTDIVSMAVAGLADSYAHSDLPAGRTGVIAAVVNVVCRSTGTTLRKFKPRTTSGGVVGYGPEISAPSGASFSHRQGAISVDPNTNAAWLAAAVDAAEFGYELTA